MLDQKAKKRVKLAPPFPLNPRWKERYDAGRRREAFVGVMAYLTLTREGNALLAAAVGGVIAIAWLIRTV